MAKNTIDFYYDVFSPYSWIAFEGLLRYEKIWSVKVNLKPFFLRQIMVSSGNKPPAGVMARGMYMLMDIERNNQFWGMNITPPAKFRQWLKNKDSNTDLAQKSLIALQQNQPDKVIVASREFWKRMWTEGEPIFSVEDIKTVLTNAGVVNIDKIITAAQTCSKVLEEVNKNTEEALDNGAYGAPWIVVHKDGESHPFFGSDRFHFIAQLLNETFTDGQIKLAAKM